MEREGIWKVKAASSPFTKISTGLMVPFAKGPNDSLLGFDVKQHAAEFGHERLFGIAQNGLIDSIGWK
jgi:hypothetical protein